MPLLRNKSVSDARTLEAWALLMRREGSLCQLLGRVEGALAYGLELMDRRTEGSTWLNRESGKG